MFHKYLYIYIGLGFHFLLDLLSGCDGTVFANSSIWASFDDDDLGDEDVDDWLNSEEDLSVNGITN